jgi:hypothetical protein
MLALKECLVRRQENEDDEESHGNFNTDDFRLSCAHQNQIESRWPAAIRLGQTPGQC